MSFPSFWRLLQLLHLILQVHCLPFACLNLALPWQTRLLSVPSAPHLDLSRAQTHSSSSAPLPSCFSPAVLKALPFLHSTLKVRPQSFSVSNHARLQCFQQQTASPSTWLFLQTTSQLACQQLLSQIATLPMPLKFPSTGSQMSSLELSTLPSLPLIFGFPTLSSPALHLLHLFLAATMLLQSRFP